MIGCLGRQRARRDIRTLALRDFWPVGQLAAPPPLRDFSGSVHEDWGMYRNDTVSDCVPATQAHLIRCWSATNGTEVSITEDAVIDAYKQISGYDGTSATDRGCVMLDALNHWRKTGIGGHQITAYVKLDPRNRMEIETAINLFGGIAVGCDMPLAAKTQRGPWDIAPANHWDDNYRPGSWGGHAMACVGYSHSYLSFVAWGRVRLATWAWLLAFCDEAYAAISSDWVTNTRNAPNGFALEELERSLEVLAA